MEITEPSSPARTPWWGRWEVPEGSALRWRIGPRTAWAQRLETEWRLAWSSAEDPLDARLEVAEPAPPGELDQAEALERFSRGAAGDGLVLEPALADRPIVTRPQTPFRVLAREEVLLFVSSPVWIRFMVEPAAQLLMELPTHRPSDTWIGTTREGELCYATRTSCRMRLEDVPQRPHRAVTPVRLRNECATSLLLERLSVPVRRLSLYATKGTHLWTEAISLTRREEDQGLAELEVQEGPPLVAGPGVAVAGPRDAASESSFVRAFSSLFQGGT